MLTDQATRDPLSGIMAAPVIAELVFGGVAVQVLCRNVVMDAEHRAFEEAEETFGAVNMNACTKWTPQGVSTALVACVFAASVVDAIVLSHLAAEPAVPAGGVQRQQSGGRALWRWRTARQQREPHRHAR